MILLEDIIKEELGIADEVSRVTDRIIKEIDTRAKAAWKLELNNAYPDPLIQDSFETTVFGKEITVFFNAYFYKTKEELRRWWNTLTSGGSYDYKNGVLTIPIGYSVASLKHEYNVDSLQHEMEHAYQNIKRGKPFFTSKEENGFYHKVLRNLYSPYLTSCVSHVLYYSYKFERDAFINATYRFLMLHQGEDELTAIKEFVHYENIRIIEQLLEIIKTDKKTAEELEQICKETYNISLKRFINLANWVVKEYLSRMGKVIIKCREDKMSGVPIKEIPKP